MVYQINCVDCNQISIGHTSTKLKTRIHNHKNNDKTNINTKQSINLENTKIVHKNNNKGKRKVLEGIYIYKTNTSQWTPETKLET